MEREGVPDMDLGARAYLLAMESPTGAGVGAGLAGGILWVLPPVDTLLQVGSVASFPSPPAGREHMLVVMRKHKKKKSAKSLWTKLKVGVAIAKPRRKAPPPPPEVNDD